MRETSGANFTHMKDALNLTRVITRADRGKIIVEPKIEQDYTSEEEVSFYYVLLLYYILTSALPSLM